MPAFRTEIRSIRLLLAGSAWAIDPQVNGVLQEYDRFLGAARLRNVERQTGLQIFFASRAFDSLLVHVVLWECNRNVPPLPHPPNGQRTLGGSINFIQNNSINGNQFSAAALTRLRDDVNSLKNQRNRFLHRAGDFPSTPELQTFLADTTAGIQEIVAWRV